MPATAGDPRRDDSRRRRLGRIWPGRGTGQRWLRPARDLAARTLRESREDRITGWAAQVAFFALLSLPPFVLAFAGLAGFFGDLFGPGTADATKERLLDGLGTILSAETMSETVGPMVEDLFERGRADLLSVGLLLAVWSSSRIVRALIDALNSAYDIEERRPFLRRRLLSLAMTVAGILVLAVFLPLLTAGPRLGEAIGDWLGIGGVFAAAWRVAYWPMAALLGIALLTTLYHVAPNWSTPWRRDLPGAILAGAVWVLAAAGLRLYLSQIGTETAFGPLGTPIVLLLWMWASALAVLLGGELNAEIEKMWPSSEAHPKAGGAEAERRRDERIERERREVG